MGTLSYARRAADPTTLTHQESQLLTEKRKKSPSSVIPVLLAGEFNNAFPSGYTGTLGASIVTLEQYFINFPEIVATLLHIRHDHQISTALREYRTNVEELQKAVISDKDKAQLLSQFELQHKSWAAKVLVLKSHFTSDQLRILDGKITECECQIDTYCAQMAKDLKNSEVPMDITEGATSSLQNRLLTFLHKDTETVLLLQAPPNSNKSQASKFVAYKAWEELNWVPVVIDLVHYLPNIDECVASTLRSHHLGDVAIQHAQATRKFMLVVEGFDKGHCQVNVYVRSRFVFFFFFFFFFGFVLSSLELILLFSLQNWKGKVIFTCQSSYIGNSVQGPYYFMPADTHQRPQPQALKVINYATSLSYQSPNEAMDSPSMIQNLCNSYLSNEKYIYIQLLTFIKHC